MDLDSLFNNLLNIFQYNSLEPLLFNSGFFLFFFFICLVFSQLFVNNPRAKVFFLLFASIYFYYKSSGVYFVLVIISSIIDFIAGREIFKTDSKPAKRVLLLLSLATNLGLLGYFKYTNFFIKTINDVASAGLDFADIFLPVGISFFTFQSLSYTIDIYRGRLEPENNFVNFLFFVSFFPQLVAGPIVRASIFLPQINQKPILSRQDIGRAFFLIITGLFKKAIIADYISINFVDRVFELPGRYTGLENLFALYGYSLQIFCDFSGYSDMAIGLALLLGFRLPDNFNSPYQSASITEFWRRWHISLSSWLKDYLYISLGGNRKGKIRQYGNLMITMLLGGLWHGASWKFVVWGGIHGAVLALEKKFNIPEWSNKNIFTRIIGVVITFHVVALCWIFFRAQDFGLAMEMINQILFNFHGEIFLQFIDGYLWVFILIVAGFIYHFIPRSFDNYLQGLLTKSPLILKAFLLVLIIWLVAQVKSADIQPFIYFQF